MDLFFVYDLQFVKEDSEKVCGDVKLGRKIILGYLLVIGLCLMMFVSIFQILFSQYNSFCKLLIILQNNYKVKI